MVTRTIFSYVADACTFVSSGHPPAPTPAICRKNQRGSPKGQWLDAYLAKEVCPRPGLLMLWPSWLTHKTHAHHTVGDGATRVLGERGRKRASVEQGRGGGERVSVSFNVFVKSDAKLPPHLQMLSPLELASQVQCSIT
jgi:hypothetical protein